VTGSRRELVNEVSIICNLQKILLGWSNKVRWDGRGHVVRMGEMRNFGLERPIRRWGSNIKCILGK
jgi:hypothetical protein